MLLQSLIKKCLEEKSTDGQKIKVELLSRLFNMFPVAKLLDAEFDKYLYEFVKND